MRLTYFSSRGSNTEPYVYHEYSVISNRDIRRKRVRFRTILHMMKEFYAISPDQQKKASQSQDINRFESRHNILTNAIETGP